VELAKLSFALGRYQESVQFARNAIQSAPGYAEAHLLLARASIALGDAKAAEEPMRFLAKNFPDDPIVQAEVGRHLLTKNDTAGARAAFERALAKAPTSVVALQGLSILDFRAKNGAAARSRVEKVASANPTNLPLQILAVRTQMATGDLAAAEKTLKQILAANGDAAEAYTMLAGIYMQQKRLPEATAEYEKLAERQPKSVGVQTAVGTLLHLQKKEDAARARYERALEIDPRAAVAANNLAQILVDRNENLDRALQLAQTAKSVDPTAHEFDDTLGQVYYKRKLTALAIASLKAAVTAQPDNPTYLYHLGLAYAQNNDKALAIQTLDKALRLNPTFEGSDNARQVLQQIRN